MKFKPGDRVIYNAKEVWGDLYSPIVGLGVWHGTVIHRASTFDTIFYKVQFDLHGLHIREEDRLEFENGLLRAMGRCSK